MLKKFLAECLDLAKKEYFETDHHFHGDENAKDAEWANLLKRMDRDFYDEWISPAIKDLDEDLWFACDGFKTYMLTKEVIEEM